MSAHLENLNPEQLQAIEKFDIPLLVLAGAGTGKTRVIVTKIAHIIKSGLAYPNEILAVTFTNKAAREMHLRISALTGLASPAMWFGTFHAIAAKILRINCEQIGLTSNFQIIDTDDQTRMIKAIMTEKNIDSKKLNPKLILSIISGWKDQALLPEKMQRSDIGGESERVAFEIYKVYQPRLKANNLVDFGDLLLLNLELFKHNPEILYSYQNRFRYILVDEYQDTNVAQYMWLRILAQNNQNICCVGDDDQSIYGWRGARIENILRFEQDFPGAKVIKLEQNYRSTKHILHAASKLISNNSGRYGKVLWTQDDQGHKIRVNNFWNDSEEAKYIAMTIRHKQQEYSLNSMAVLVRASFQTRVIEEEFMASGISYAVIGNMKFYERMEVKDIIAYLRLTINQNDDLALERIINKPRRGVGNVALQKLKSCATEHSCSLFAAITILIARGEFKGQLGTSLDNFVELVKKWNGLFKYANHKEVVETMIEDAKYLYMLDAEKISKDDAENRISNVKELVNAIGEFDNIEQFLEHVSLATEEAGDNNQPKVSLMTLHAAKGLEFELVFLPGWEEGIFPSGRTIEENSYAGLEEERRLAYVGITRARKECHISSAKSRRVFGQWQYNAPSRFIEELPGDCCEMSTSAVNKLAEKPTFQNSFAKPIPVANSKFQINQRVEHNKFGRGIVVKLEGEFVHVYFEGMGIKKMAGSFLKNP